MLSRNNHAQLGIASAFGAGLALASAAWASPTLNYDLRVHSSGGKTVSVGLLVPYVDLDLYAVPVSENGIYTDDGFQSGSVSIKSAAGGLLGNLSSLGNVAPFNAPGSQPGTQSDLDGDGDLDVGSNNLVPGLGWVHARAASVQYTSSQGQRFLIGQFRFTPKNSLGDATLIVVPHTGAVNQLWATDGAFRNAAGGSIVNGGGSVVITRTQDAGSITSLSGTLDTHLSVPAGTQVVPEAGTTLTIAKGLDVASGGVFDTVTNVANPTAHEVRIDDTISGNGGLFSTARLYVGYTTEGAFTQTQGITAVTTLAVGVNGPGTFTQNAGDVSAVEVQVGQGTAAGTHTMGGGSLIVSGALAVGKAGSLPASFVQTAGLTQAGAFSLTGSAASLQLSGGTFTVTGQTMIGGGASATIGGTAGVTLAALTINTATITESGGSVAVPALTIGASGPASYTKTGGTLTISPGDISVGNIASPSSDAATFSNQAGATSAAALHVAGANAAVAIAGGTVTISGQGGVDLSAGATMTQSGGKLEEIQSGEIRLNGGARYSLTLGTISLSEVTSSVDVDGGSVFSQSGGSSAPANIRLARGTAGSGRYNYSGGSLSTRALFVGTNAAGKDGHFVQTGATSALNASSPSATLAIEGASDLSIAGGTAQFKSITFGAGQPRVIQTSGTMTVGTMGNSAIPVVGVYQLSGGTLALTSETSFNGTIDFGGGPGTLSLAAGFNYLASATILSPSAATLVLSKPATFVEFPEGFDPLAQFAAVTGSGMAHAKNSPLSIGSGNTLQGVGTVHGNTTNGGTVAPGNSPGKITIQGNYTQMSSGSLNIEVETQLTGGYDMLAVTGDALLAGQLNITRLGTGFSSRDILTILTANSVSGTFSNIESGVYIGSGFRFDVVYRANSVYLTHYRVDVPEPATLAVWGLAMPVLARRRRR